jgi:hypothetical protein
MSKFNTEELVSAYLALRNSRAQLKEDYEESDAKLKTEMEQVEQAMLEICNDVGADSIKTTFGTVIRKVNERFYCTDWDNFKNYVLENEAVELLERRIHQGNFKEHMTQIEGQGLPPGVNVMREYGITVRKAS